VFQCPCKVVFHGFIKWYRFRTANLSATQSKLFAGGGIAM
jgi:hypothetical protein